MELKSNKKREVGITIINILCICVSYFIHIIMLNYARLERINENISISIMIALTTIILALIVFGFLRYKTYKENIIGIILGSLTFVFIIIISLIPGLIRAHNNLLIDIVNRIAASIYSFAMVFEIVTLIKKIITKTTK